MTRFSLWLCHNQNPNFCHALWRQFTKTMTQTSYNKILRWKCVDKMNGLFASNNDAVTYYWLNWNSDNAKHNVVNILDIMQTTFVFAHPYVYQKPKPEPKQQKQIKLKVRNARVSSSFSVCMRVRMCVVWNGMTFCDKYKLRRKLPFKLNGFSAGEHLRIITRLQKINSFD